MFIMMNIFDRIDKLIIDIILAFREFYQDPECKILVYLILLFIVLRFIYQKVKERRYY